MKQSCDALIIGGSAGSLEVLLTILPLLREDLAFPVIVVLHRKAGKDQLLTDLLKTKTHLLVKELEEKETIEPATIYIAPPNYHVLIEKDHSFSLDASEKVNFSRPSIDVTFESAADVYGKNLVCLLLSGSNNDGSFGLQKVKEQGGRAIIQDPDTADVPFMPQNAADTVAIDQILTIDEMAGYINQLNK